MNQMTVVAGGNARAVPDNTVGESSVPAAMRWLLVYTKPAAEGIAKTNLERQGYNVYFPRLQLPSLSRGRWVDRIVSLFPRYLFLQLDTRWQSLAPVRSTLGVANIVRFGLGFPTVPETIVADLMCRADPETGLHRLASTAFRPGMRVNIIAGAFEGLEGIFERETGEERSVILLRLLGQETPVRVPTRYISPAR